MSPTPPPGDEGAIIISPLGPIGDCIAPYEVVIDRRPFIGGVTKLIIPEKSVKNFKFAGVKKCENHAIKK